MRHQHHAIETQMNTQALDVVGLSPQRSALFRVGRCRASDTSQVGHDQAVPIAEPGQVAKITGVAGRSSRKEDERARVAGVAGAGNVIVVKC